MRDLFVTDAVLLRGCGAAQKAVWTLQISVVVPL
jgi:hypothetical protein